MRARRRNRDAPAGAGDIFRLSPEQVVRSCAARKLPQFVLSANKIVRGVIEWRKKRNTVATVKNKTIKIVGLTGGAVGLDEVQILSLLILWNTDTCVDRKITTFTFCCRMNILGLIVVKAIALCKDQRIPLSAFKTMVA